MGGCTLCLGKKYVGKVLLRKYSLQSTLFRPEDKLFFLSELDKLDEYLLSIVVNMHKSHVNEFGVMQEVLFQNLKVC